MIEHLEKKLFRRQTFGNLRELQITDSLVDFSSNDYLGLARSSQLVSSFFQEWEKNRGLLNGLGSTGSRLLTGNSLYAQALEERIAEFHGYQAGVLFNCGYMANVGLFSAIVTSSSNIFFDAGVHASTCEGIRLSKAQAFAFRHNDVDHLENRLKSRSKQETHFICIESLYSTDGSIAPLHDLCQLAHQYHAHLIVDEAHAVGICGPKGRGLVAEHGLTDRVFAQITTFGKALGVHGAIILGCSTLKRVLHNFSTSYIYTTALPFQALAAIKCSYDLFPEMEKERQYLQKLIQIFRKFYPNSSQTPIHPIPIKGNEAIKKFSQDLAILGFDVRPLMSPTVQREHERLRICLHAFNSENELTQLLNHIKCYRNPCDA